MLRGGVGRGGRAGEKGKLIGKGLELLLSGMTFFKLALINPTPAERSAVE